MSRQLSNSSDFQAVKSAQRQDAIDVFGRDPEATSIAGFALPYTPVEYADLVYNDWGGTFHPAALREAQSLGASFVTIETITQRGQQHSTLSDHDIEVIRADEPLPLTFGMNSALGKAYDAYHSSTKTSPAGVRVLSGANCAKFWDDGIGTYIINCEATRSVVTDKERWKAFFSGLEEGAENVGDAVGKAAANVLSTAGRSLGSGVSSFFGELGVVQSVVLVGAGVLAFRVL